MYYIFEWFIKYQRIHEFFDNCLDLLVMMLKLHMLIEKLKNISITKKINKTTIKYIVGDLETSFPQK